MNAIMNKTNNGKRLMAAIAVLALIACAFVAFMPSAEADGIPTAPATGATPITNDEGWPAQNPDSATNYTISVPVTLSADTTVYQNMTIYILSGGSLTVADGVTVTLYGTINVMNGGTFTDAKWFSFNNTAAGKLNVVQGGTVVAEGTTLVGTQGAFSIDNTSSWIEIGVQDKSSKQGTIYTINGNVTANSEGVYENDKLTVSTGSKLTVSATTYRASGEIDNDGTVAVNRGSELSVYGQYAKFSNDGALVNNGKTAIHWANSFVSAGTITNNGTITTDIKVTYSNTTEGSLINNRTFEVLENGSLDLTATKLTVISSPGNLVFHYGSALNVNSSTAIIGTGAYEITDENGKIALSTNSNGGTDMKIDGKVALKVAATVGSKDVTTVNANAEFTVNAALTNTAGKIVNNGKTIVESSGGISNGDGTATLGVLINNGTLDVSKASGKVTGTVALGPNGTILGDRTGMDIVSSSSISDDSLGLKNYLESDYNAVKDVFLSADLTVREGVTLTISSTGSLNLNGFKLILEGNLVVMNNGGVIGIGQGDEGVYLTDSGSIQNSGVIGKGTTPVTVYAAGLKTGDVANGSVEIQNVTGISFDLDKKVDSNTKVTTYTLTFSGNAVRNGTGDYTITAENAFVNGDLTIGNDVVFTSTGCNVLKDSDVIINGTIGGTITLENNSTIALNGKTDEADGIAITAKTGSYQTNQGVSTLTNTTTVTVKSVKGIVFSVSSYSYMDTSGTEDISMTEQKLIMSGSASQATVSDEYDNGFTIDVDSLTATSGIYVEDEFYYPQDQKPVSLRVTTGTITVTGQISSDDIIIDGNGSNFVGTAYDIGTGNDQMYYITGFDQAYGQIANANSKTITVYGKLTLSGEYTIASGQTLDILNSNAVVTIDENGAVDIENGGIVNGTVYDVDGVLIVYYGGSCNAPTNYDVRTTNEANDVIYSGLAYALNNSSEGQTINLVGDADVEGSLTIPAGVTLDVNADASLTVERNLTVNGTLNNHGQVNVGRDITVAGNVDTTEGTQFANGAGYKVTVTGKVLLPSNMAAQVTSEIYNGTSYTNDDGFIVVTSLATAVADVADYDVKPALTMYGKVTETGTVALDDVNLAIASGAEITVGEITLSDCKLTVPADAVFTGNVTGQSGEEESTVASTVALDKVSAFVVENKSARNSANVNVWTTAVNTSDANDALVGKVTVSAGTITLANDLVVVDDENDLPMFTVASGATFVVPADSTFTSNTGGLSVDGTMNVSGTFDANGADVAGTLDILKGGVVNVTELDIIGTLNVSADEEEPGKLVVKDVLTIGEKPETLGAAGAITGKITFDGGYVKAYAGADMSTATFEEGDGVSTAYSINGFVYMTVYAANGNSIQIAVVGSDAEEDYDLSGYDVPSPLTWYAGEKEVKTESIGFFDSVSATFTATYVKGTISEGTGMTMYIDSLTLTNFQGSINGVLGYYLTVGTHTVTIAADAQYDISNAVITFNGQTVENGGTIEITADMVENGFVLSCTGAVPATTGGSTGGSSGDSGMGLTDYLLIILVILIVVMAIMVAMRLMRS